MERTRFAPTCSGHAHPGTLLAGMLAWCDAKQGKGHFILRMEDIDPSSVRDQWRRGLLEDLTWFGLSWDELVWQRDQEERHRDLVERLAQTGRLYACSCTRSMVQRAGLPSIAGGWRYPGTCRHQVLGAHDWDRPGVSLRINLKGLEPEFVEESGIPMERNIEATMGDPVLRRPDGTYTYQCAVVADDHGSGITRIVRGHDIASSTATQAALYLLAGWKVPRYHHHFLLLEPRGEKLAKFHGSVAVPTLSRVYGPSDLVQFLATCANIPHKADVTDLASLWQALGKNFSWDQVPQLDRVVDWDGSRLILR